MNYDHDTMKHDHDIITHDLGRKHKDGPMRHHTTILMMDNLYLLDILTDFKACISNGAHTLSI